VLGRKSMYVGHWASLLLTTQYVAKEGRVWKEVTKYINIKSTTVYVPSSDWDSPTPSLASECAPSPGTKGGRAHSPAGEGSGESQFRRLEKRLSTLPALWRRYSDCDDCDVTYLLHRSIFLQLPRIVE
jgi:hypothetical protein